MSAILEAKRTNQDIDVVLPQFIVYRVRGDLSSVTIADNQRGSTLVLTNTTSMVGLPFVGDLFKLDTHPKVYKITKVAKEGDKITLNIYPDLFIATTGIEKPVFNNISFKMKLMGRDKLVEDKNVDGMYEGVEFTLRESL